MQNYHFRVGNRYTYPDKDWCVKVANKAKAEGYTVKFGTSYCGQYYFEIEDPFKTEQTGGDD